LVEDKDKDDITVARNAPGEEAAGIAADTSKVMGRLVDNCRSAGPWSEVGDNKRCLRLLLRRVKDPARTLSTVTALPRDGCSTDLIAARTTSAPLAASNEVASANPPRTIADDTVTKAPELGVGGTVGVMVGASVGKDDGSGVHSSNEPGTAMVPGAHAP